MPAKHFVTRGTRSDRLRRSESKRANNEATFRTIANSIVRSCPPGSSQRPSNSAGQIRGIYREI
jgi:hypothetical protein